MDKCFSQLFCHIRVLFWDIFSKISNKTVTEDQSPQTGRLESESVSCSVMSVTLRTVVHQAPLSMGFSRQEHWSRLPFRSPGDFPDPGSNPDLLHCRQIFLPQSRGQRTNHPKLDNLTLLILLFPASCFVLYTSLLYLSQRIFKNIYI